MVLTGVGVTIGRRLLDSGLRRNDEGGGFRADVIIPFVVSLSNHVAWGASRLVAVRG